jgi:hypothetical protein
MKWRALFSSKDPIPEGPTLAVVDQTSELLGEVARAPRVPWVPIGFLVLALLWLPTLPRLSSDSMRGSETAWIAEAEGPESGARASAFARQLTRSIWEWQGIRVESGEALAPEKRQALRIPAAGASFVGLLVFFLLARLVVGNAAALFALALLGVCTPWIRAGTSFSPLIFGEVLVLLGVVWALMLQDRHREVSVAPVNATRIGVAGLFLGIGLLLVPAGFATLVATVLVWFLLGLRRSNSDATTLPVESPRHTTFLAILGTIVLLGASIAALLAVERFSGGTTPPFLSLVSPGRTSELDLWTELYRKLLSPTRATDVVVVTGLLLIGIVRGVEWFGGRPWQSGGLIPWAFLGWFLFELTRPAAQSQLLVPVIVPALFLTGLGWLLLRGLHPGRARRQEYTFLLVWLLMGVLCAPLIPRGHPHEALMAAAVTILPAMVLAAARAARALWEWNESPLARLGVVLLAYAPVLAILLRELAERVSPLESSAALLGSSVRWLVLLGVALGLISQLVSVRPDAVPVTSHGSHRNRRGRGRGTPRRRTGRTGRTRRKSPSR